MGIREKMRVLLGSGGNATEPRREMYRNLVSEHFSDCREVVFVPYASDDHEEYTSRMQHFLGPTVPNLVGLHKSQDPVSAISHADAIYVGGGNSFLLIKEIHERCLVGPIKQRVISGIPYLGVSAGSNVASPTMMTTNDMPIVLPPSFESMGIVPFQINPHYYPGRIRFMDGNLISEHFGETRSKRISEFHRQIDTPVLGMWEGSYIQWDGEVGRLIGRATAFRVGEAPVELQDGDTFDASLVPK